VTGIKNVKKRFYIYDRKCRNVTRLTPIRQFMLTLNSVFIPRKSVNYSYNFCSNRTMNLTTTVYSLLKGHWRLFVLVSFCSGYVC